MHTDDYATLAYTLGAVQNVCQNMDCVRQIQREGHVERLQILAGCGDEQLEALAGGVLTNMREAAMMYKISMKLVKGGGLAGAMGDEARSHAAASLLQKWARRRKEAVSALK